MKKPLLAQVCSRAFVGGELVPLYLGTSGLCALPTLHTCASGTQDERIAKIIFASVYPLYIKKVESKGRTIAELNQVIEWLTNFNEQALKTLIAEKATFETFFKRAQLNPHAKLITGVICGYRIEAIENPLTQQVRYLDKLVDELAKGKKMEKILRG